MKGVTGMEMHFTVDGCFVTNLAREKLFIEKDLAGAIKLLRSSLVSDDVTPDEQLMYCLQVLHGAASIKGTSGSGDYGLEFRDGIDENPTDLSSISRLIADMAAGIEALRSENRDLANKVCFISERLGETALERVNADYYNEYDKPLFSGIPVPGWRIKNSVADNDTRRGMLDSYLAQRRREDKMAKKGRQPDDYGWLEPDGTWHPVGWGGHAKWAAEWLDDHMPFKEHPEVYWRTDKEGRRHITNGDVLVFSLGWVLMDSPWQGLAKPTADPARKMTKAQKEFLYGYYVERGRHEEANALYED